MKVEVNKYSLTPRWLVGGTKGSYDTEKLEFTFSKEWEGLTKRVTFYPYGGEPVNVICYSSIAIPYEVMTRDGICVYAISGFKDNKKLLTVSGEIQILDTVAEPDGAPIVPTPDLVTQITQLASEAYENSSLALQKVESAVENANELVERSNQALSEAEELNLASEEKYQSVCAVKAEVDGMLAETNELHGQMQEMSNSVCEAAENIELAKLKVEQDLSEVLSAKEETLLAKDEVNEKITRAKKIFGNSLLSKIEGKSSVVTDASPISDISLAKISVFGKTLQNGSPTPSSHSEVESIESPTFSFDETSVNIPLFLDGSSKYRDEVVVDRESQTVKLIKRYYKYIFTGQENWNVSKSALSGKTTLAVATLTTIPQANTKSNTNFSSCVFCNAINCENVYSEDKAGMYVLSNSPEITQFFARIDNAVEGTLSTKTDFNNAFGEGVCIYYPVAVPTEVDYTGTKWGQELLSLSVNAGCFTFECDADTEITYNQDINKVITKLIDAIVALGGTI